MINFQYVYVSFTCLHCDGTQHSADKFQKVHCTNTTEISAGCVNKRQTILEMENLELKRQLRLKDNHIDLLMRENERLKKVNIENKRKIDIISSEKAKLELEVRQLKPSNLHPRLEGARVFNEVICLQRITPYSTVPSKKQK